MAKTVRIAGIEGGKELQQKLKDLGKAARRKMVHATRSGANVLRDEMRRLSGSSMSDEIVTRVSKATSDESEIEIGPTKHGYHLVILELGAQSHPIKPKRKQAMAFEGKEGQVVTTKIGHPGMRARPFMRPAVDTKENEAKDKLGEVLKAEIEAVCRGG